MKRQRNSTTNDSDNVETKKFQRISSNLIPTIIKERNSITHFEHLSNDLICEIFQYLDSYYIYKAFFNLNIRFQNIFLDSNIPIKINISTLSKSSFENYYINFILPNKHRIQSIYLTNPFTIDDLSSLTECSQLQTLLLHEIESKSLEYLLQHLSFISNLSSLSIHINHDSNKSSIYNLIFNLPVLKYCKISFEENTRLGLLPISINPLSSIEHLVIIGICNLNELKSFLSYIPQLRHLSIKYINGIYEGRIENCSMILNNLISVSLKLEDVEFDNFEQFVKNHFRQVQSLYISTKYDLDYSNAKRWEQLIEIYLPYLQIFDFQLTNNAVYNGSYDFYKNSFDHFNSLFWFQRQWFFTLEYTRISGKNSLGTTNFYSTQPYRRKYFILSNKLNQDNNNIYHEKTIFNSVHHIIIQDETVLNNCSKYFPNVTELSISDSCINCSKWFSTDSFHRIIPLIYLTKLNIDIPHLTMRELINILRFTPNIHTLTLISTRLIRIETLSSEESKTLHLVSSQSKIVNITIKRDYSMNTVRALISLCSGLQHVTVGISPQSLKATVRFLLSKNIEISCYISSLCVFGVNTIWIEQLKTLIESEKLLNDYLIEIVNDKFYLWW